MLRTEAEKHHLTFAPDPSTHTHNTLGGMIGNNSCGVHSLMGLGTGRTSDQVHELEILLYDGTRMTVGATSEDELARIIAAGGRKGEIYARLRDLRDRYADEIRRRYPKNLPRRVSGFNLDDLLPERGFHVARALSGTEGTCVTMLEASLHLVHSPAVKSLLVLGYPDVYSAGDHVPDILESQPTGLEGLDDVLVHDMKKKGIHPQDITLLPEGGGWLLVEFGGETKRESDEKAHKLMEALGKKPNPPSMKLFDDEAEEEHLWKVRESGLGATARIPGEKDAWEGWEDSAVPPDKVGPYLRDLRGLLKKYGYNCSLYGHFGQGCIHTRIDFDLKTVEGVKHFREFLNEAGDLVVSYGGSISGEHGDGQSKAALLPKMFGHELVRAFGEFKAIWDPDNKMNPHKVVDPYLPGENLRLGPHYHPQQRETHFKFPDDHGSFSYATERCVGIGECRKELNGTMCPSYMATKEEMHSTRGRAHLLFEMFQGDPMKEGWNEQAGSRSPRPLPGVQGMPHRVPHECRYGHVQGRVSFALLRVASAASPRLRDGLDLLVGPARLDRPRPGECDCARAGPGRCPQVSGRHFEQAGDALVRARDVQGVVRAKAAESRPAVPASCSGPTRSTTTSTRRPRSPPSRCWRPRVSRLWCPGDRSAAAAHFTTSACSRRPSACSARSSTSCGPEIEAGTPFVGLEPSCVAVFRDELCNLFPMDEDAKRLRDNTFILSEFLEKKASHFRPPRLHRKAIVQKHCHHDHVMGFREEDALLRKLGLDYEILNSGCCGMAGSFGFESGHYDVSVAVGERVLLPAVRAADASTLIIADGFSCREQIAGLTGRGALHLAQLLQMALHEGPEGPREVPPERNYQPLGKWSPGSSNGVNGFTSDGAASRGNGRAELAPPERSDQSESAHRGATRGA